MAARLTLWPFALLLWASLAAVIRCNYFLQASASDLKPEDVLCNFGYLPCDSGDCVRRSAWCDGVLDCNDDSDERYCRQRSWLEADSNINDCVKSLHFQCANGKCIPRTARCDDLPDCDDRDDEENCDYSEESSEEREESKTTPKSTTTLSTLSSSSMTSSPLVPLSDNALQRALRFVLNQRDSNWGWGSSTAKMTTVLQLANRTYFEPENVEGQLTKKQMEVLLAIDLMKRNGVSFQLPKLAHYIHALLLTCHNPKDFHGVNLVKLLKKEIGRRRSRKAFVSPLAYLALCNAGEHSDALIRRIKNMAYRRSEEQRWLDVQAYALLIISCYTKSNNTSGEWKLLKKDVAKNITEWQQQDGSFGSVYSTGLVLQALIAAEEPGTETTKGRALTYLKIRQDWEGSFGSELDNFYVIPALNFNSMISVADRHCKSSYSYPLNTEASNHEKNKKRINVHYSLWIGGEKNEIHTITLSLVPHTNFLEIMEAAERSNPKYKHEVWNTGRGPIVHSIAGRASDVEKGSYWTLYRRVPLPFRPSLSNVTVTTARLKLLGATKYIKDLRKLYPKNGEHLAFWFRPYF